MPSVHESGSPFPAAGGFHLLQGKPLRHVTKLEAWTSSIAGPPMDTACGERAPNPKKAIHIALVTFSGRWSQKPDVDQAVRPRWDWHGHLARTTKGAPYTAELQMIPDMRPGGSVWFGPKAEQVSKQRHQRDRSRHATDWGGTAAPAISMMLAQYRRRLLVGQQ